MDNKIFPLTKEQTENLVEQHPTPLHVYDEKSFVENGRNLRDTFSWNKNFKEFFAIKATPNPSIMKILNEKCGFGMDCSSLAELMLCEKIGVVGENIMFSSNETLINEYDKAIELGAIINLDDISHIDYLGEDRLKKISVLSFRYNPGPSREGNAIIGDPKEAKFGLIRDQLFEAYKKAKELGVNRFGIHTMVVSNELDKKQFDLTAKMLFELVVELKEKLGIDLEFVNLGGGFGIPYKPEQDALDVKSVSKSIQDLYQDFFVENEGPNLFMENGRYILGPYGYLITKVVHTKNTYKKYLGVDACMANLMRPGMYGAYHHISVLGKENQVPSQTYDVVGSLCENNDKFAINRELPEAKIGDLLIIHDSGAHGHSMGFNYNGKLRSAEVLIKEDGTFELIRRAETYEDLFATLNF